MVGNYDIYYLHTMSDPSLIQRQEDPDTYVAIAKLEKSNNYFQNPQSRGNRNLERTTVT